VQQTKRFAIACGVLSAAVLSGAGQCRADFVPWSYNFTPSALVIPADNHGTGGLALTNEPANRADGTSDVVITNVRTFSSALRSGPDQFAHADFGFSLVLTDLLSKQSAKMKFAGFFSGSFSQTSANVQATYTAPLVQTVELGGHTYTVNLGNYAPPGPPDASNAGSISAHIGVDEIPAPSGGDTGGGMPSAPEPSTFVLGGIGVSGLGVVVWRKWRERCAALTVCT
jgi:hypothetical protein